MGVVRRSVLTLFVVALGCGGGAKTIKMVEEGTNLANIDHDRARPTLRGVFPALRDCYASYLKVHGPSEGQVRFTIELRPNGTVASLNVDAESTVNDKTMLSCMASAITSLEFGATSNGAPATINYALGLYPYE